MSRGGWAKLRKQQQQETTHIQIEDDGAYQVHNKYKKVISSKKQLNTIGAHPQYSFNNTTLIATTIPPSIITAASPLIKTASSPPPRTPILPVDQANPIRASTLMRIVRRWKALSAKPRSRQSSTSSSSSCSILSFVPLSCITSSSSFQSQASDPEEEGDSDAGDKLYDVVIASDSTCSTSTNIPTSSPLHYQSVKAEQMADWPQSSACRPRSTAKEKVDSSTCKGKTRPLRSRRTLSCPKLIKSPLRSCTSSPIRMYGKHAQEEELSKSLQPKGTGHGGDGAKLRRSSSSPLKKTSGISKQASYTPKGYLALYVGKERKRFLVKANVVNHPMFSVLLEKTKEEFGFDQKGALNIPCDIALFEHIMVLVESNHKSYF